jgi:hypothetical protein
VPWLANEPYELYEEEIGLLLALKKQQEHRKDSAKMPMTK